MNKISKLAVLGAVALSFAGCSLTLPPSRELSLKMAKEQDLNLWCLVVDATAKEKFKNARRLAVTYYNSPKYEGQVQIGPRGEYSIADNDQTFAKYRPLYELYIRDFGIVFHAPYCDIPNKKIVEVTELTPKLMRASYEGGGSNKDIEFINKTEAVMQQALYSNKSIVELMEVGDSYESIYKDYVTGQEIKRFVYDFKGYQEYIKNQK
jgi:putative lipoprotein